MAVRRACRTSFLTLLLLRRDYRLEILALSPLLLRCAIGCLRDLLRLVDSGLLDIGPIHGATTAVKNNIRVACVVELWW
jgi:hypothetical protein